MTHIAARVHELHPGPMKALSVTASRIATGGSDGVVRVMAANGEHLAASTAHDDIINSVAVGPSGLVASGSRDRTIRIFDPAVRRSYVVGEHDHWVMSVAWSDDGSQLVSGSEDGAVAVWDPEGSSVTRIALGSPVNGVDWRAEVIAAVTSDGALHLMDHAGAVHRTIAGAEQMLWSVALSPDGGTVAWTGRDRRLRIAPVGSGDPVVIPAHAAGVWSIAWDARGNRLVTGGADGSAAFWSPTGEVVERVTIESWVRRAIPRGTELFLATEDGHLRIFSDNGHDPGPSSPISIPQSPAACIHWDPQVEAAGPRPRCIGCGSADELRLCVTCGHVGCCESQLAHATKHWLATGHPTTIPVTDGDPPWRWCYADDMYVTGP